MANPTITEILRDFLEAIGARTPPRPAAEPPPLYAYSIDWPEHAELHGAGVALIVAAGDGMVAVLPYKRGVTAGYMFVERSRVRAERL